MQVVGGRGHKSDDFYACYPTRLHPESPFNGSLQNIDFKTELSHNIGCADYFFHGRRELKTRSKASCFLGDCQHGFLCLVVVFLCELWAGQQNSTAL
jgi:hypothetical protein